MSSLLQCYPITRCFCDGLSLRPIEPHHLARHFDSSFTVSRRNRLKPRKLSIVSRGIGFELPGSEPRRGTKNSTKCFFYFGHLLLRTSLFMSSNSPALQAFFQDENHCWVTNMHLLHKAPRHCLGVDLSANLSS